MQVMRAEGENLHKWYELNLYGQGRNTCSWQGEPYIWFIHFGLSHLVKWITCNKGLSLHLPPHEYRVQLLFPHVFSSMNLSQFAFVEFSRKWKRLETGFGLKNFSDSVMVEETTSDSLLPMLATHTSLATERTEEQTFYLISYSSCWFESFRVIKTTNHTSLKKGGFP